MCWVNPDITHKCAKYFLVFVHALFVLMGSGIIVGSTYTFIDWKQGDAAFLTDSSLPNFNIAGIVIGVVLVVLSCFGVIAGLTENRCCLILNSFLLIVAMLLFVCLGAAVFIIQHELTRNIASQSGRLWDAMRTSWIHAINTDPNAVCDLQVALQCAGFADGLPYGGLATSQLTWNSTLIKIQLSNPTIELIPGWSSYCINPFNTNYPPHKATSQNTNSDSNSNSNSNSKRHLLTTQSNGHMATPSNGQKATQMTTQSDPVYYCTAYDQCTSLYKGTIVQREHRTHGCMNKVSEDIHEGYEAVGWATLGCALILTFTIVVDCLLFYHLPEDSAANEKQGLIHGPNDIETELGGAGTRTRYGYGTYDRHSSGASDHSAEP